MKQPAMKQATLDTHNSDDAWMFRNYVQQHGVYAEAELDDAQGFSGIVTASTDVENLVRLYQDWRKKR